jgi:SAM-dependent methyltransferase
MFNFWKSKKKNSETETEKNLNITESNTAEIPDFEFDETMEVDFDALANEVSLPDSSIEPQIREDVELNTEITASSHFDFLASYRLSGSMELDFDNDYLYQDPKIVGYTDRNQQAKLFSCVIPYEVNFSNDTILDVGCGVGDLYAYIEEIIGFKRPHYTGIDYNKDMIDIAQHKFLDVPQFFNHADLTQYAIHQDWIIASSIFNIKYYEGDTKEHLFDTVKLMVDSAKKGVSFNIITKKLSDNDDFEGEWVTYNKSEILDSLSEMFPDCRINAYFNYLDGDCTFQIIKPQ